MKRSVKRFIALVGIMFALRLSGIAILQPTVARSQSPQADARAVVQKICGAACHALERATVSPRSRAQWEDVISKMISMGAKGTDEELATVLNYLATNYGRDTS